MPKQHTLLGRRVPHLVARRMASLLLALALFAIALVTLAGLVAGASPSSLGLVTTDRHDEAVARVVVAAPRVADTRAQAVLTPLRPPRQKDDEYAGASWWADAKWLSVPFSSSLTLDDHRALLPPLAPRPPIYCYFDDAASETPEEREAEAALLYTWRRAWWARGFKPFVLTPAGAVGHPSYAQLARLDMGSTVRDDFIRWLAWHTAGGGVLTHHTLLPTADDDDVTLSRLRLGRFSRLTRWQHLGDALLAGNSDAIGAVIEQAMHPGTLATLETGVADVADDVVSVDETLTSLSSYTQAIVHKKYPKVAIEFGHGRARGLRSLNKLITTHLHISWQNRFTQGIAVLKPHPEHSTAMIKNALKLAHRLASCSETPMPSSCPPNQPRCAPCVATAPMQVSTPARYRNSSHVFSIGTVPHPWTFALLDNMRESLDVSWVRRESARDPWLTAITQALLGGGASGNRRVRGLKEVIAGERAAWRSLWLPAEKEMPDVSWYFGFPIPEHGIDQGKSKSPVPAARLVRKRPKRLDRVNGPEASREDVAHEAPLLGRASRVLTQTRSTKAETRLRAALEAWNMADTETWKFVRAFQARNALEREQYEVEEAQFGNGTETKELAR